MKIGIIGTGHIGKTLVKRLSAAGHEVKVSNSRGPRSIEPELLSSGAKAVSVDQAVLDVDVLILSVPLGRIPDIAPHVALVPENTVVIDTSNYYPARDGHIEAIDAGQVESEWVQEQLGRRVVKAWNAIGSDSFARNAMPAGAPGRIAIPVAADREDDRRVAMALVNETGLDAFDAGAIADSWRQHPAAPCYCTDLSLDEMEAALASTERARLPKRRDLSLAAIMERMEGSEATNPDAEFALRLTRALFM